MFGGSVNYASSEGPTAPYSEGESIRLNATEKKLNLTKSDVRSLRI
jgi:hypothetical protein